MEVQYNVTGERRKELAKAVGGVIGCDPVYQGPPTYAYAVGSITISRNGALCWDERTVEVTAKDLVSKLRELGFIAEEDAVEDGLTIEMPLEGFTETALENLDRLIASKAVLIKKAIGADALPVQRTDSTLRFQWFRSDHEPEEVSAYTRFIGALCAASKEQRRVTAKEKHVENEKFAFRVFLIRLGFVGDEYKTVRRILLKNLPGNSAFKNGNAPKTLEAAANE